MLKNCTAQNFIFTSLVIFCIFNYNFILQIMRKSFIISVILSITTFAGFSQAHHFTVTKPDAEWKKLLSPEAYQVTRKEGTERAFSGKYWNNHEKGVYRCVCCNQPLFSSVTKFESGTGWPSFWQPINKASIVGEEDSSYNMDRTKVTCSRCGAHLGHVFEDGPKPTGLRYCINSVSLVFAKN